MNPLLQPFNTKYQTAPFNDIKEEHYLPAFRELVAVSQTDIDAITSNPEPPTFENTLEALAYSGELLDVASNLFFNLNSAETNDEIQRIAQQVSPLLTEFSSKISQNEKLFARIKTVFENKDQYDLNEEQQTLLDQTYKDFVRSGALLNDAKKKQLEQINMDLSVKSLQFGQNVLASTNAYFKHITDKNLLAGIPETILEQYADEAKERGLEGYVITLQYPSYLPAMTYAEDRELRQELALANGKKSFTDGDFDNKNLIREIIQLRRQKAQLLGYQTFAEFVLEERMAKSPGQVIKFLNELLEKATPFAQKEMEELKTLAKRDGIDEMQSWDHAFYAEKLRKQKFDLNDEELKPYFQLEKVQEAVFGLAEQLFGLTFKEVSDIPTYHSDVKTYEVYESNDENCNSTNENGKPINEHYNSINRYYNPIDATDNPANESHNGIDEVYNPINENVNCTLKAILYVDYHPRKGKRAGAWMTSFKNQFKKNGENHRPHISVVCNFTKPTADTPSLLTFQEVTTLFHEFGHALHGILADTQYPHLSGTSVKWDFVELPSQFLENYCYEPEFLKTFAKHYQTGKVLLDQKIQNLSDSKNFMEGYQTLRQLGFGLLDMAYHSLTPASSKGQDAKDAEPIDIKKFEEEITAGTSLYPKNPETAVSTSFSHIFQGGYSAGYYSYKWAEVLDADAFQYFKEKGIFNQEIAAKFKALLSSGGTKDPMELYKNFRGSEPKVESLLKRAFGDFNKI